MFAQRNSEERIREQRMRENREKILRQGIFTEHMVDTLLECDVSGYDPSMHFYRADLSWLADQHGELNNCLIHPSLIVYKPPNDILNRCNPISTYLARNAIWFDMQSHSRYVITDIHPNTNEVSIIRGVKNGEPDHQEEVTIPRTHIRAPELTNDNIFSKPLTYNKYGKQLTVKLIGYTSNMSHYIGRRFIPNVPVDIASENQAIFAQPTVSNAAGNTVATPCTTATRDSVDNSAIYNSILIEPSEIADLITDKTVGNLVEVVEGDHQGKRGIVLSIFEENGNAPRSVIKVYGVDQPITIKSKFTTCAPTIALCNPVETQPYTRTSTYNPPQRFNLFGLFSTIGAIAAVGLASYYAMRNRDQGAEELTETFLPLTS